MIVKLKAGKYLIPVTLTYEGKYIYFQFRFNKPLMADIKVMEGAHWCGYDKPPHKVWRVDNTPHNQFQLAYLKGEKPYAQYDGEIIEQEYSRPLYAHQKQAADFIISRRRALLAAEMGCVGGNAVVTIRRGKNPNNHVIFLSELYRQFHQGTAVFHRQVPIYIRTIGTNSKGRVHPTWVRVLNVHNRGTQPCLSVEVQDQPPLLVTSDHEISTNYDEFIEARHLRVGDLVRSISESHNLNFLPVVSIGSAPDCPVYDVVCDDPHHHFLANNVLVHNCGKTLVSIELMERSETKDWWYVAPRSALKAVERELIRWDCKINPEMMTYEGLTKRMKNWEEGRKAPEGVVFDESSRIKNPTAQRSQAALALANGIRKDHNGYILLMSGAPAPKSPPDWFQQCKVACPGFLKEGNIFKFKNRLAIIIQKDGPYGQAYPHIVTWLDDEKKCKICGKLAEDHCEYDLDKDGHAFEPSKNEVAFLYKRMSGLVLVQLKKDCLDLPDKIYRRIELPVTKRVEQIAKTIVAGAKTVVSGLTLLREVSDGFQYRDVPIGWEECPVCCGSGEIANPLLNADIPKDSLGDIDLENQPEKVLCDGCGGKGKRRTYSRTTTQVETAKDAALVDLLDEYGEVGRVVIYAAFTGSVDRCVSICEENGWAWIRVDGRGWHSSIPEGNPLENFQEKLAEYPRIAFIGNAGAAGLGLTLTASPVIIYYSNSFNFEDRVQSEDRIHRIGMDTNRGATIVDLLYLPTDILVLDNLQKKRKLQALSLGDLTACLNKHGEIGNATPSTS